MLESERILNIIEKIDEKILLLETKASLIGEENMTKEDNSKLKKLNIEKNRLLVEYDEAKFNEYVANYNKQVILRRSKIYRKRRKDKETK